MKLLGRSRVPANVPAEFSMRSCYADKANTFQVGATTEVVLKFCTRQLIENNILLVSRNASDLKINRDFIFYILIIIEMSNNTCIFNNDMSVITFVPTMC